MRILKKFIQTIVYYCQGKGNPWRLIIIWYFLLNILALLIGFSAFLGGFALITTGWWLSKLLALLIFLIVATLGQIITFIYPFIFSYALCRCAFNVKWEPLGFMIAFLTIPFLIVHIILGRLYFDGSAMMFYGVLDLIKKW